MAFGLSDKLSHDVSRHYGGHKSCGVHWPNWRFAILCASLKEKGEPLPITRGSLKFDGEAGVILDDQPHGCPVSCTRLFEQILDGISRKRGMASNKSLANPGASYFVAACMLDAH